MPRQPLITHILSPVLFFIYLHGMHSPCLSDGLLLRFSSRIVYTEKVMGHAAKKGNRQDLQHIFNEDTELNNRMK